MVGPCNAIYRPGGISQHIFVVGDSNFFSSQEMSKHGGRWQEHFNCITCKKGTWQSITVSVRSLGFAIPWFMVISNLHPRLISFVFHVTIAHCGCLCCIDKPTASIVWQLSSAALACQDNQDLKVIWDNSHWHSKGEVNIPYDSIHTWTSPGWFRVGSFQVPSSGSTVLKMVLQLSCALLRRNWHTISNCFWFFPHPSETQKHCVTVWGCGLILSVIHLTPLTADSPFTFTVLVIFFADTFRYIVW